MGQRIQITLFHSAGYSGDYLREATTQEWRQ